MKKFGFVLKLDINFIECQFDVISVSFLGITDIYQRIQVKTKKLPEIESLVKWIKWVQGNRPVQLLILNTYMRICESFLESI